ncbi:MAG: hypothetical protein WCP74_02375 [Sphingobacteriia bacterium]
MKRIVLILLISIYTTATFGFGVKQFFCCYQLKSTVIAFASIEEKKCGMDDKMDNCCKTKYTYCKVKDTHFGKSSFKGLDNNFYIVSVQPIVASHSFTEQIFAAVAYNSNPPPLHRAIPIYKLDCVFLI